MLSRDGWLIVMLSGRNVVDSVIVDGRIYDNAGSVGMTDLLVLSVLDDMIVCVTGMASEEYGAKSKWFQLFGEIMVELVKLEGGENGSKNSG